MTLCEACHVLPVVVGLIGMHFALPRVISRCCMAVAIATDGS